MMLDCNQASNSSLKATMLQVTRRVDHQEGGAADGGATIFMKQRQASGISWKPRNLLCVLFEIEKGKKDRLHTLGPN